MTDPMQGIENDVTFDFGSAELLKSLCTTAASQIDGQAGSRASYTSTALTDFQGFYSQLFAQNAQVASSDATELAAGLRLVASDVAELVKEANEENKRRADARAWKEKHDHRGFGGWLDDTFGDGDDCPIPSPKPPISQPARTAPTTTRLPLSGGGGGGGTSSARPDHLTSFATGSVGLNDAFTGRPGLLSSTANDFSANTTWGSLNASGVFTAFGQWLSQNANDVKWAKTVAAAFTAAGGSGAVSTLPNTAIHSALASAGVDEARSDIAITMPSAYGHPPTTGYANDPVNTSTGNFTESEVDLEFTDAASDLWWRRAYNSVDAHAGAFGPGWSSWCDTGLSFSDEAAAFTMPDGRQITFPRLGDGWDRGTGENLWLTGDGDDLVVSDNDGSRWIHTAAGRLTAYSPGEGRTVTLDWDGDRLVGLTHQRGRSIIVEWADERIAAVSASDGRRIDYDYDQSGRLVAATGPLGTRRYVWNDAGLIAQVVDADGVVEVDNAYDEHGRVTHQRSPFGRTTRFAYLPGRVTVVSDEDGTRANTWIADTRGRLVGVIDAHDQRQCLAYDEHGNRVLTTARAGEVTVNEYDERGRQVREVAPSGAEVTYAYDEADRVVRVVVVGDSDVDGDGGAVTTYDYFGEQRGPSAVTDPEGGVTRLEWADGLLQTMTDPTGVAVRLAYDEHGSLVSTTDADGATARLERDATGRVVAAVTPSGARTSYSFDPASGLAVRRTDPDGATWHYEYTTAGRLRVVTDPSGARTEVEYAEHGEESATIDPLGRAVRRTYDDLGYVAHAELPDGSTWEFVRDALGRLLRSVDPVGGVRETEYDATGAQSATTDPTGVRRVVHDVEAGTAAGVGGSIELLRGASAPTSTRLDVDKLGRLVSETAADGTTRLTRYDRCGRPVEIVDPIGGLTRLERDAAGRVTTMVKPSGAEIGYTYDACGRLASITDETGATLSRVYDADGHVVEQHLPTGEVATTRYDECGRVVALRVPGVGTTTYSYDATGRVVETRDPANGRRRFGYDAAGQLVTATDGNGGETGYAYDANGRCTAITAPDGATTRRAYDANSHVVAETDPLGRRTTATYDAAGRQTSQTDPTGSTTEWRHDDQGRIASTWVDGVEQASIERDPARRMVRVVDRSGLSGPAGEVTVHELTYDPRGLLVSRARDGRGVSWDYDADGSCTALTMPDGTRTSYARDAAGRLVGVSHPLLGAAVIERDEAGRMVTATAGGTTQRWTYADGFVDTHETARDNGDRTRTTIARDDQGRIERIESAGESTAYSYDEANQLLAAATTTATGLETITWRYDAAGRLVAETLDADGRRAGRELAYDVAGQVTATRVDGEDVVTYSYDGVGRRSRETYADGATRSYDWSATGWLSAISTTDRLGDTRRTDLVVDALGELARLDGVETIADTASPWGGLLAVGDEQIVRAGAFTGTTESGAGSWADPGWRDTRPTGPDPWSLAVDGVPELPVGPSSGFEITPTGDLLLGGGAAPLEWMGSRVYDPSTRGFLSVDPLDPTTGAGWAGNPYAYAGNDPLHALDPLGLHPVTDAELKAYNAHNGGLMDTAAGKWLKNNWEYVAGGLMVVGGVALMFAPFPGAQNLGMGLASAGADVIVQKATTGEVNWKEVAVSGVLGALPGAGEGLAAKAGLQGWKAAAAGGAIDGAWQGAVGGGAGYLTGPGPHTVGGLLESSGTGAAFGTATGGALGGVSHVASNVRHLGDVAPTPETPALTAGHEPLALPAGSDLPDPYKGQPVYRVYGGDAGPDGASWSPVHPGNVPNYRDAAGLPSGGASGATNSGRFVIEGTLNDPSAVVKTRAALPLDGTKGGVAEYIIPHGIESGAVSVDRVSGVNPEF